MTWNKLLNKITEVHEAVDDLLGTLYAYENGLATWQDVQDAINGLEKVNFE